MSRISVSSQYRWVLSRGSTVYPGHVRYVVVCPQSFVPRVNNVVYFRSVDLATYQRKFNVFSEFRQSITGILLTSPYCSLSRWFLIHNNLQHIAHYWIWEVDADFVYPYATKGTTTTHSKQTKSLVIRDEFGPTYPVSWIYPAWCEHIRWRVTWSSLIPTPDMSQDSPTTADRGLLIRSAPSP